MHMTLPEAHLRPLQTRAREESPHSAHCNLCRMPSNLCCAEGMQHMTGTLAWVKNGSA